MRRTWRDAALAPTAGSPVSPCHYPRRPDGPVAVLRRHRRLGAHRAARPARAAAAPRRRPAAVRLRRGHAAPARCAPSACPTSTPSSSPTSTPTTGSGCPGCSSPSRCATASAPLTVYGPPGPERAHGRHALRLRAPAATRSRSTSSSPARRVEFDGYEVAAFNVRHRGQRLRLRDRRGRAPRPLRRRARRASSACRFGPDFGRLQRGETVDGVTPEQVVGPEPRPGASSSSRGDTGPVRRAARRRARRRRARPRGDVHRGRARARARRPATAPRARPPSSPREADVGLLALTHLSTPLRRRARSATRRARSSRRTVRAARLRRDRGPVPREGRRPSSCASSRGAARRRHERAPRARLSLALGGGRRLPGRRACSSPPWAAPRASPGP